MEDEQQVQPQPERMRQRTTIFEKALLVLGGFVVLAALYISLDANKYTATVHVIEGEGKVGINPTTERLDFGDLSPGASAVRTVTLTNGTAIPIYVFALRLGAITGLMKQEPATFILAPRSEKKIEFSVYMPASAPVGETLDGRVFLFKVPGLWKVES